MNVNGKAISFSAIVSFLQSIAVVYFATTPRPETWLDIFQISFVMSWLVSLSGVTLASHMNFRSSNTRTRLSDSVVIDLDLNKGFITELSEKAKKEEGK